MYLWEEQQLPSAQVLQNDFLGHHSVVLDNGSQFLVVTRFHCPADKSLPSWNHLIPWKWLIHSNLLIKWYLATPLLSIQPMILFLLRGWELLSLSKARLCPRELRGRSAEPEVKVSLRSSHPDWLGACRCCLLSHLSLFEGNLYPTPVPPLSPGSTSHFTSLWMNIFCPLSHFALFEYYSDQQEPETKPFLQHLP